MSGYSPAMVVSRVLLQALKKGNLDPLVTMWYPAANGYHSDAFAEQGLFGELEPAIRIERTTC